VDRDCINFNYDTLTCISCKIGKKINGASCLWAMIIMINLLLFIDIWLVINNS
jgi:hypothetical protein